MDIDSVSVDEWAEELPASGVSVFHSPEALRVFEKHGRGDLSVFLGHNGNRLVGMMPVFRRRFPGGCVELSPPNGLSIPYQGPMLLPASPKQRKQERLNREFTTGVVDRLDARSPLSVVRFSCHPSYPDPRPLLWEGFGVTTKFTYRVDLEDTTTDDVKARFSRSLRREIDAATDLGITVEREGVMGAKDIFDDCAARYAEQERYYPPTWPYVRDMVVDLGDRSEVFVTRGPDGEYLGGIIALYSDETAFFWQGGTRHKYDGVTTNSFLHWQIISDILENPDRERIASYDLVGANKARLCEYKSKFGGRLTPYYHIESTGAGMSLAKSAYSLSRRFASSPNTVSPRLRTAEAVSLVRD